MVRNSPQFDLPISPHRKVFPSLSTARMRAPWAAPPAVSSRRTTSYTAFMWWILSASLTKTVWSITRSPMLQMFLALLVMVRLPRCGRARRQTRVGESSAREPSHVTTGVQVVLTRMLRVRLGRRNLAFSEEFGVQRRLNIFFLVGNLNCFAVARGRYVLFFRGV